MSDSPSIVHITDQQREILEAFAAGAAIVTPDARVLFALPRMAGKSTEYRV